MTRRGYESLQEELKRLKFVERPRVVREIKTAREHGDLSENAEYDAAKEKQGLIEGRIKAIEDKLARAEVVETHGCPSARVRFGATVLLEDLSSGEEVTYRLVGEDEADVSQGLLSVTSPVGRALIGKALDDAVAVSVPAGMKEYEIRDINYE
jgi:transcription elongation factor GreA